jgi:hypothetical protein
LFGLAFPASPQLTNPTQHEQSSRPDGLAAGPAIVSARRVHWGWLLGFAFIAVGVGSNAFEAGMHFAGPPLDGPFQLFNSLRRIADGQRIGDTFQFFHGPAVPYFFLPAFLLGGGTFFASEESRQLLSALLFFGTTLLMCRAWAGNWRGGLPLAVAASLVMIEFRLNALLLPINSLLGLRTTMPLLIGAHLLLRRPGLRADVERGVLIGLALLLGTEQGMASIAALGVVSIIAGVRRRELARSLRSFASAAGLSVVVYLFVVLLLAGPSHVAGVLRFNFAEVTKDQLWYFGAPPNPFLSEWSDILPLLSVTRWWIVLAAAVAIACHGLWRGARADDPRRPIAEAFLMLYGLVSMASMLGSFVAVYAEPAIRVAVFVVLFWMYRQWPSWRPRLAARLPHLAPVIPLLATCGLVLATVLRQPVAVVSMVRTPLHVILAHVFGSLGSSMRPEWRETESAGLAAFREIGREVGHQPTVWSTYAGLIEADAGVFHPYTDYIIHALGPRRRAEYAERFVELRPDLVQTIRPSFSQYEEWLEGTHWNFYRPLFMDYDIMATGPWSFFWARRPGPPLPPQPVIVNSAVPEGQLAISAPTGLAPGAIGLFEVRIRYHTRNSLARLPVIGGLPRYLVDVEGTSNGIPISLAPYATERAFPVVAIGSSPILLRGHVASLLGGASLTIDSIRVERIPVSRANTAWVRDFVDRPRQFGPPPR